MAADANIKQDLNRIFETNKFNNLRRLRNANGRGRHATFFYVIRENNGRYYSEKRFSTGELAVLRLVEKLVSVENNAMVLLDEAEMALHPRIQKNLLDYLKNIAELPVVNSAVGLNLIVNDNGSAKQIAASAIGGGYSSGIG